MLCDYTPHSSTFYVIIYHNFINFMMIWTQYNVADTTENNNFLWSAIVGCVCNIVLWSYIARPAYCCIIAVVANDSQWKLTLFLIVQKLKHQLSSFAWVREVWMSNISSNPWKFSVLCVLTGFSSVELTRLGRVCRGTEGVSNQRYREGYFIGQTERTWQKAWCNTTTHNWTFQLEAGGKTWVFILWLLTQNCKLGRSAPDSMISESWPKLEIEDSNSFWFSTRSWSRWWNLQILREWRVSWDLLRKDDVRVYWTHHWMLSLVALSILCHLWAEVNKISHLALPMNVLLSGCINLYAVKPNSFFYKLSLWS